MRRRLSALPGVLLLLLLLTGAGQEKTTRLTAVVPSEHTVTLDVGTGGRVQAGEKTCAGKKTLTLPRMAEISYTVTADKGYAAASATYNGEDVTADTESGVFTAPPLNGDSTLTVRFEPTGVQPRSVFRWWLLVPLPVTGFLLWLWRRRRK